MAQSFIQLPGPLGVYHITPGYSYSDTSGTDSMPMERVFEFGELAFPNQDTDHGFHFQYEIDSCNLWNANRVTGIIQPPMEDGIYNQPNDTSLYFPFDISDSPGMIQGGERFSRLSKIYGPFCSVILDDWNGDT